jgi:hypothetical protein
VSQWEESWWWLRNPKEAPPIDWGRVWQFAVSACEAYVAIDKELKRLLAEHEAREAAIPDGDEHEARGAAAILGVSVDAPADEIRAALRRKLGTSRLHPDHGGDNETAKRFIAAKNLLVERSRRRS